MSKLYCEIYRLGIKSTASKRTMNNTVPYTVLIKYLTRATYIFLVAPYLIFFSGWLHWWLAIPMIVVCLLPILWDWRQSSEASISTQDLGKSTITLWQIVVVCSVAFLFVLISGIGGWGWQNADWEKHNTL
jgi:hypothetical protein